LNFRPFILSLLFICSPILLLAQASFTTIADELTIRLNGIVQVQYVVENAGRIESFQPPVFRDFRVMQGPMETSGMSMVNNQLSEYKALTYVLQPLHKGRLTVPGATAVINGKTMVSNKVIIEVGEASAQPYNPYPRNPGISALRESAEEDFLLGEQENANDKIKHNLLVKLDLNKTTAYIGESIVATYKLYTRLRSESRVSKRPSMNGFSVYDMPDAYGGGPVVEKINGKHFMMHIIRKSQLIPLQEGSFVLEPVELENNIRFLRSNNKTSAPASKSPLEKMFDDLLSAPAGEWEDHKVTLSSEPRQVEIKALPDGAPVSFNGAVGKFSITGRLLDSTVSVGENASYELKVEGSGNMPLLNAPEWKLPVGFNIFEPSVSEEINKMAAPMEGSKVFTYTFTMGKEGVYTLPPLEFCYFDPVGKSYQLLQTGAKTLTVVPASGRKANIEIPTAVVGAEPRENTRIWLFGGVLLMLLMVISGFVFLRKKKQQIAAIAPVVTADPVPVLPPDPLAAAKQAAEQNMPHAFYKAVAAGLWSVIAEKTGLPVSAQQKEMAITLLAIKGLPGDNLQLLKECWSQCEWALYVPAGDNSVNPTLLVQAIQLVRDIEQLP